MSKPTILCVDDEANILSALTRSLRNEPYTVLTAASGSEALELLKKHKINVIISDYRMPEMKGTELLKTTRTKYPDMIRVILSGYSDIAIITEAISEGDIFLYLEKPWDDEELKKNIQKCLEKSSGSGAAKKTTKKATPKKSG